MRTAFHRAVLRWNAKPKAPWLALTGIGVLAAAATVIFPSAPASDAWLPYELQLRVDAQGPGRIALWWDRHAGYVTSDQAAQTLPAGGDFGDINIPCPAGPMVRLILQLSPIETRMQPVATIRRHERPAAVLSLREIRPLHGTCAIAWEHETLVVRPLTPSDDAQLELLLQPALALPVPQEGAPARLLSIVQRERLLAAALAAFGLGLFTLVVRDGRHPSWKTRSMMRSAILAYATLAILFARRPDIFALPQFWAEDGAVFFVEQHQHGFAAVLKPYAGYLHVWPRLVAAAASNFPSSWAPMVYLLGSLVALLLAVMRAASPRTGLLAPVACALAIVLLPRMGELLLHVTNAQWFGAIVLLLIAIARAPVSRTAHAGDAILVLVFGLTGPFTLLLLPLFAARLWRDRDASAAVALLVAVVTALVQVTWFAQHTSASTDAAHSTAGLGPLFAAAGLRTGGEFLGVADWMDDTTAAWAGIVALAGWAMLWFLTGSVTRPGTRAMLGWAALAVLAGGLARYHGYPDELFLPTHAQRYFHLPLLVTTWLLLAGVAHAAGWRRAACGTMLGLLALQLVGRFRIAPLVDYQWSDQATMSARGHATTIPINPAPWAVVLPATSDNENNLRDPSRAP